MQEYGKGFYPTGFNANIDDAERHSKARAGSPMRYCHDYYALASIMSKYELKNAVTKEGKSWREFLNSFGEFVIEIEETENNSSDHDIVTSLLTSVNNIIPKLEEFQTAALTKIRQVVGQVEPVTENSVVVSISKFATGCPPDKNK
jgi:hypothetical protein